MIFKTVGRAFYGSPCVWRPNVKRVSSTKKRRYIKVCRVKLPLLVVTRYEIRVSAEKIEREIRNERKKVNWKV